MGQSAQQVQGIISSDDSPAGDVNESSQTFEDEGLIERRWVCSGFSLSVIISAGVPTGVEIPCMHALKCKPCLITCEFWICRLDSGRGPASKPVAPLGDHTYSPDYGPDTTRLTGGWALEISGSAGKRITGLCSLYLRRDL